MPDSDTHSSDDGEPYTACVSSELHEKDSGRQLLGAGGGVLSRFSFKEQRSVPDASKNTNDINSVNNAPNEAVNGTAEVSKVAPNGAPLPLDEDGDLVLPRRKESSLTFLIEHQLSTPLALVGEQVWRGALYLGDYLLGVDEGTSPPLVRGRHVLELAAGVGLTSLVAGRAAASVTVTDLDRGNILTLVKKNIERNKDLVSAEMHVAELDFCQPLTIEALTSRLSEVTLVLVADVVYDNRITDAFMASVENIMSRPPNKTLLVALEKRYVFTIADLDTVAPCYEYFLEKLREITAGGRAVKWRMGEVAETEIPQYFDYERSKQLVLWKITAELQQ